MEQKHSYSLVKKKFRVQQSVYRDMLNVFRDMKAAITMESLKKEKL